MDEWIIRLFRLADIHFVKKRRGKTSLQFDVVKSCIKDGAQVMFDVSQVVVAWEANIQDSKVIISTLLRQYFTDLNLADPGEFQGDRLDILRIVPACLPLPPALQFPGVCTEKMICTAPFQSGTVCRPPRRRQASWRRRQGPAGPHPRPARRGLAGGEARGGPAPRPTDPVLPRPQAPRYAGSWRPTGSRTSAGTGQHRREGAVLAPDRLHRDRQVRRPDGGTQQ